MFFYVAVHFLDHALGLISLDVAERALALSVAVWQGRAGTLLLYGAAALHVGLALQAVYERRTLRMPPAQLLRLMLGLAMPILLIGHVVATRMAVELHALAPTYTRIVWALWMSDSEGRQLALQAPGWIHGCLGLQFAFGQRRWWIRARPVLFGTALLLPVLAALGFLSMGRELATMAEAPGWMATVPAASSAAMIAIGRLRDGILTGYFLLIGAVFAARELRAWIERHRRLLVSITYPMRTVEVPRGWTVLEASRGFGIPHLSMCGGQGRCSTCRVRVLDGAAELPPPSAQERNTLERIQAADDVRLACQLRPTSRVVLEPLLDPVSAQVCESQQAGNAVEREVAILFVKVAAWTSPRGIQPSPHDLVYALNRLLAVVGDAIETAGGLHGSYNNEGASATFGSDGDLGDALQRALQAAAAIEHALEALNARLLQELGILAKFTIALHSGPAAIGPVGYGRERARLPVGATVRMARLLRDHAAARGARFAISRAAAQAAGWPVASMSWRPLGIADPAMGDAIEGSLLEHVGRPG